MIMKLLTIEQYSKLQFLFVQDHYDIHLVGLCKYKNKLCFFITDYDTMMVSIYSLSIIEKIKYIKDKKLFELCIGYHWTYPYRKLGLKYNLRKPKWFWKIVFNCYYKRWCYFLIRKDK